METIKIKEVPFLKAVFDYNYEYEFQVADKILDFDGEKGSVTKLHILEFDNRTVQSVLGYLKEDKVELPENMEEIQQHCWAYEAYHASAGATQIYDYTLRAVKKVKRIINDWEYES